MSISSLRPSHPFLFAALALALAACETEGYDSILDLDEDFDELDELDEDFGELPGGPGSVAATMAEAQVVSGAARVGRVDFEAWPATGKRCLDIVLVNDFAEANEEEVRIQVGIDHVDGTLGGRDATSVWVENLSRTGARLCVRETAKYDDQHQDGLSVAYRMYRDVDIDVGVSGQTPGVETVDSDENLCTTIEFEDDSDQGVDLSGATGAIQVNATLIHHDDQHNAAGVWVREVDETGFEACIREIQHGGNMRHFNYEIDWVAFDQDDAPSAIKDGGTVAIPTNQKCEEFDFAASFSEPPLVFATIDRAGSSSNNAGTVWIEDLSTTKVELCAQGLTPIGDTSTSMSLDKANMRVHWFAL